MTERHMQTNAPLSWWPGKGNDFLCPSKQHPHDWSVLGAEPCCGLTWSQDGRFYNRHCPQVLPTRLAFAAEPQALTGFIWRPDVCPTECWGTACEFNAEGESGAGTRNVVKITAAARKTRQSRRWWQQARHKSCQLLGKVSPLHARGEETWGQWTVIN